MMTKRVWAGLVVASMTLLGGCGGGFFIDTKTTGTATSSSGDYIYLVNTPNNTVSAYTIASGALTLVSGSTITAATGLQAASVTVSRANTYVFVGGQGTISSYSIGSTGALTLVAAQAGVVQGANFTSLETSPDGQWLFAMDSLHLAIYVFKITTTSGVLTINGGPVTYASPVVNQGAPAKIRISPNAAYLALALGAGGDELFTFNTASTSGLLTAVGGITTPSGSFDTSVQFDGTSAFLYISRVGPTAGTSTIQTLSVAANGLTGLTSTPVGDSPNGLLLDYNSVYLYSANSGAAALSGFKVGATTTNTSLSTLTQLPNSPFASGPSPTLLVEDNSNAYVVVGGTAGGSDLTLYKFDVITGGVLDAVGTTSTGATGIAGLAATHH